jgi:hypothetical protein
MSKLSRKPAPATEASAGMNHTPSPDWPPIPFKAIGQIGRPPTMRYRQLANALVRANQALEAGDDELYVILKCVVSVITFLDQDVIVRGVGLTRPFGILAAALRDLDQGARPQLFFDRPKKGPGRPKDISFEVARGAIAAAVAMLMEAGESRHEAGRFVANQVRRAGLRSPEGKPILGKHVIRWRYEMGGAASPLAESTFRDILAKYSVVPPEVIAVKARRRALVEGALMGLWSAGF